MRFTLSVDAFNFFTQSDGLFAAQRLGLLAQWKPVAGLTPRHLAGASMRCGHGLGVATVMGASHGSDVRLTPRDELSKQQATLVIWSSPNEAAHFSGCRALLAPPADCLETTLSGASSPQQLVRFRGTRDHLAAGPTSPWEWVVPSRIDVLLESSRVACNGTSAQNYT